MPRRREPIADLLAHQDFAALERAARDAVRDGDLARLAEIRRPLLTELMRRWRAHPLPRLGELVTQLGRHCQGPATRRLAGDTRKKLPVEGWTELWAEAEDDRDTWALLEAAARGTSDAIHYRVGRLRERFAEVGDPQVTSAFLRWLEAPPIRAVSSQPMWGDVFEILFDQGDPRTPPALSALAEGEFQAGDTMRTWMKSKLRRELDRWRQRDDADALAALADAAAEGDQADVLDAIAALVAALTGEELIARGGEVLAPSVEALMQPVVGVSPWADARAASLRPLEVRRETWHGVHRVDSGRLVVDDGHHLVVLDPDDRLVWQMCPAGDAESLVSGYALSPSGRALALVRGGRWIRVVDLDDGTVRELELPLPSSVTPRAPYREAVHGSAGVLWLDETTVLTVHPVSWSAVAHRKGTCSLLVETRLSHDLRRVEAQRVLDAHEPPHDPLRWVSTSPTGRPVDGVWTATPSALHLSPDGQWLAMFANDTGYHAQIAVFERHGDDWRLRQRYRARQALGWDGTTLLARRIGPPQQRSAIPVHRVEPTTAHTTPAGTNTLPRDPSRDLDAVGRTLPVGQVGALSVAAQADVVAVQVAHHSRALRVLTLDGDRVQADLVARDPVHALAMAPDGESFAWACKKAVLLQTVARADKKPRQLKGHKDPVTQLAFTEREPVRIVSRAADGVRLWSLDGDCVLDLRHRTAPTGFALRADGRVLATREAQRVSLWELLGSGQELASVELDREPGVMAWSADGASLLWTHDDHELWHWQPGTDTAPQLAARHDARVVSLTSRSSLGVCVATDDAGRVLVVETTADGVALRPVMDGLERPSAIDIDRQGRIVVGCGRAGEVGSVLVLEPSEGPGRELTAMHTLALDAALPPGALPAFEVERAELAVVRDEVLARDLRSSVPRGDIVKVRKRLTRERSRVKAIAEFAAMADEALWLTTLAEVDPDANSSAHPVFGHGSQMQGWMIAWLAHAPEGLALVEAWQRTLTDSGWADPALPLELLRSPYLERVAISPRTVGEDLRDLPALHTVRGAVQNVVDTAVLEALLQRVRLPEGRTLTLSLDASALERLPPLLDTPFDRLDLSCSSLRTLTATEPLRELSLRYARSLESLAGLEPCAHLERLTLSGGDTLRSLAGLDDALAAGAPLRDVELRHCKVLEDLSALRGARRLERFAMRDTPVRSLEPLRDSSALRELELEGVPLTSLDGIASKTLETVALRRLESLVSIDALAASAGTLRELTVSDCPALRSAGGFSEATSLRSLDLRGCASLTTLPALDHCTQLERIWLHGTGLTPDDVSPFVRERASWAETPL